MFSVLKEELINQISLFPSDIAIKIYEKFRARVTNRSKYNGAF